MTSDQGRFIWYELMTPDVAAAKRFYGDVVGWTAQDMEPNVAAVQEREALREGTLALVERAVETARTLLTGKATSSKLVRGVRKAQRLEAERTKLTTSG